MHVVYSRQFCESKSECKEFILMDFIRMLCVLLILMIIVHRAWCVVVVVYFLFDKYQ